MWGDYLQLALNSEFKILCNSRLSSMVDFFSSCTHLKQERIHCSTLENGGNETDPGNILKLTSPFYGWRNWGSRRLNDMPEVPQWACSRATGNALHALPPRPKSSPTFNPIIDLWKVHLFISASILDFTYSAGMVAPTITIRDGCVHSSMVWRDWERTGKTVKPSRWLWLLRPPNRVITKGTRNFAWSK